MLTIDDITTELDEMAEQAEVIVEMLHDLAKSGRWDKGAAGLRRRAEGRRQMQPAEQAGAADQ